MKFPVPLVLALLIAGCATPEDPATAHQRRLHEQARENFLALKARERKSSPPVASAKPVASVKPRLSERPVAPAKLTPFARRVPPGKPGAAETTKPATAAKPNLLATLFTPRKPVATKPYTAAKPTPSPRPAASPKRTALAERGAPSKPAARAKPNLLTTLFTPRKPVPARPGAAARSAPTAKPATTPKPSQLVRRTAPAKPVAARSTKPAAPAKPGLFARLASRSQPGTPATATASAKPPKATAGARRGTRRETLRRADTIYEPTNEGRAEQRAWELRQAREYQAFEVREARRLGKKPSELTRKQRAWIRARF